LRAIQFITVKELNAQITHI